MNSNASKDTNKYFYFSFSQGFYFFSAGDFAMNKIPVFLKSELEKQNTYLV